MKWVKALLWTLLAMILLTLWPVTLALITWNFQKVDFSADFFIWYAAPLAVCAGLLIILRDKRKNSRDH